MWESFFNRTESPTNLPGAGDSNRTHNFYRRKLDLPSVEYQSYMHKNVIKHLDRYARPVKRKSGSPRRSKPKESPKSISKEEFNENIFIRANLNKLNKSKKDKYIPIEKIPDCCSILCKSICRKLKNTGTDYIPIEKIPDCCGMFTKTACKKLQNASDSVVAINAKRSQSPRPAPITNTYKNCQIVIDKQKNEYSFKLWNPNASDVSLDDPPKLLHVKLENGVLKNEIIENKEQIHVDVALHRKKSERNINNCDNGCDTSGKEEKLINENNDNKLVLDKTKDSFCVNPDDLQTQTKDESEKSTCVFHECPTRSFRHIKENAIETISKTSNNNETQNGQKNESDKSTCVVHDCASTCHHSRLKKDRKEIVLDRSELNILISLDEEPNKGVDKSTSVHYTTTKSINTDNYSVTDVQNEDFCVKVDKNVLEKSRPHRLQINPQPVGTAKRKRSRSNSPYTRPRKVVAGKEMAVFESLIQESKLRGFKGHVYKFGEKGSGYKSKGEPQDFYKLRDQHLDIGTLFEDPEFPANDSSLFFSQRPDRHFQWKRPGEIASDPQLFVEGFSRFDVQQGELGDCWLLAATANLTLYKRLFFQIVPDDQDFSHKYAGIFHFRFWQYGRWIDVVIDDRLPTYNGQLVFLHSTEENEFWSALLEKAYAKLHGSYEALKGGSTCEAMEDFTGGVTEMFEMEASPPNLFQIMIKAFERASLMGCSIEADPKLLEAQTPEGLIRGHAYSITRVQYVDIKTPNTSGKIPLLRLRNPWGNESEWNGPWSDGAQEWQFISESDKENLGLTFDHDGEFWMSYRDFQKYFSRLEICNLNPDSLSEEELQQGNKKKWEMSVFEGEWVKGVTAGGCRNFLETFVHNPQYRVTLTDVDEDDDDGNCTAIVALMQKNRRQIRQTSGVDLLTIGFAIYHLTHPDRVPKPLDLNFFKYNASVARSPSFINLREVSCRFKLPPGTYCIVPSTFDPNQEGEFLVRVFSESKNNMEENDEEIGFDNMDEKVDIEMPQEIIGEGRKMDVQAEDEIYEYFLKLSGADKEVDWRELKLVLDHALKQDLQSENHNISNNISTQNASKANTDVVNSAESQKPQTQNDETDFLSNILSLFCGSFCKDSAVVELVPKPNHQNSTLMASFSEFHLHGFSKDICRSMVAMLDTDRSGKLGFEEFKVLWNMLQKWKDVWALHDVDNSGSFSGFELRAALNLAGYRLNNRVLNVIMHRYGNRNGEIAFDDFLMCAIKLKTMLGIFQKKDESETNTASFSKEEWLEITLSS